MVLGTADGGRYCNCNLLDVFAAEWTTCERASHKRYPRPFSRTYKRMLWAIYASQIFLLQTLRLTAAVERPFLLSFIILSF
jgi:hypothetical protein